MIDFVKELTRRKVWLFGGIYLALGWVLLQVAVLLESTLKLPDWIDQSALVLLVIGFPVALLLAWAQESRGEDQAVTSAGVDDRGTGVATPGHPSFSIAVLSFDDLSRDGSFQEMADGLPEDVLTQLSSFEDLRVTARNSSFAFKGTSPDIRDVGEKLRVRFVLEGSVRKVGTNVRTTAQLIDTLTGDHIWSENYDRPADGDGAIDEITRLIVREVVGAVTEYEQFRLYGQSPKTLEPEEIAHVVQFLITRDMRSEESLRKAEALLDLAMISAPDNALLHARMAQVLVTLPLTGVGDEADYHGKAREHMRKAKAAGRYGQSTLLALSLTAFQLGQYAELEIYTERLRRDHPAHPGTWGMTALQYHKVGKYKEALEASSKGQALCSSRMFYYRNMKTADVLSHLGLRNFAEVERQSRTILAEFDTVDLRKTLVIGLAYQGKEEEARAELQILNTMQGEFSQQFVIQSSRLGMSSLEVLELQLEGLRLMGVE